MIFQQCETMGSCRPKFLVSRVKDIDMVGFLSFFFSSCTQTTIKILLEFPAFTFKKPKEWSIPASNTEANSVSFIMRGDHLNFAIPQGGITKILLIQWGDYEKFTKLKKSSKGSSSR